MYIFNFFFKLLKILVSQESSYFSHYLWQIMAEKMFHLENISENLLDYGNHNKVYTV